MSLDFITALELIRGEESEIDLTGHSLSELNMLALANAISDSTHLQSLILAGFQSYDRSFLFFLPCSVMFWRRRESFK